MKRPKILVSAAQHLIDMSHGKLRVRSSIKAIEEEEKELNDNRLNGVGGYTYRKHIEILAEYMLANKRRAEKCT